MELRWPVVDEDTLSASLKKPRLIWLTGKENLLLPAFQYSFLNPYHNKFIYVIICYDLNFILF